MDTAMRELERELLAGDTEAGIRLSRMITRAGRTTEAQQILISLMDEEPTNQIIRENYVAAGGFYPQRIYDEYLGDAFLYQNLCVAGKFVNIVQGNNFLGDSALKPFEDWKKYVEEKRIKITSSVIEAAIQIGWFSLRQHSAFQQDFQHYYSFRSREKNRWYLCGKLHYMPGTTTVLEEYSLDGDLSTRTLDFPLCDKEGDVVAPEQPEALLGKTQLSDQHERFLQELFKADPKKLISAFQYLTSRIKNGNMREVRIWTPVDYRRGTTNCSLGLGPFWQGWFEINCYSEYGYALGWRYIDKKPRKNVILDKVSRFIRRIKNLFMLQETKTL